MSRKSAGSLYSPHPSIQYARNVLATLERKTGKSWEEWVKVAEKSGLKTEQERRDWLKAEQGLGTNTARWIAEMSVGKGRDAVSEEVYLSLAPGYVEAMYATKSNLRPIHDALIELGRSLGPDVKVCPVPDDCAPLPESCLRRDQADHEVENRFRLCLGRY